ncbi:site-specific integrase [Methylobacterium dankookense]|uniref:Tyrosine recombinase XerC n=1 Tax=Methylobacterium dankookense TaxID=560405 RepID=A0A564G1U1_9HYPH|nr:site-specific integrase [Methylobacterium dankookense]GJD57071.1 Tyrosine recombinase XerC [Methylobacterium dankookense]VUF13571.1 Tyrosine recombinase XerC [Methylobacterium dankookense]
MAAIRKRQGKYQVQIRIKGSPPLSRTFSARADAKAWAREIEGDAERRGLPMDRRVLDTLTVGDILVRYRDTITPTKLGAVREGMAIRVLLKHGLSKVPLSALTVSRVAEHRDQRLQTIKPASINRELAIYRHAFETAQRSWGIPLAENPFALVTKPRVSDARSRRLEKGEWEKLKAACLRSRNPYVLSMVEFGLETAMRRGEVLRVRWRNIDWEGRTLHIPRSKNGYARTIPLSVQAINILMRQSNAFSSSENLVFETTEDAIKLSWQRIVRRCGIVDFRYHDLRHEAISRFFEKGLSVPEVALISGHRDYKMLARYVHLRPEVLAEKLARLSQEGS